MPLLFSYGTLQQGNVQLSVFGRLLRGEPDQLVGFEQTLIAIEDPQVIETSGKTHHLIVKYNGRADSHVSGTVFEISDSELEHADRYEVAAYKRVGTTLASGRYAWLYVDARMDDIRIIPTALQYADSFNAAVDIVARERRYIGLIEGPSIESTRAFLQRIVDGGGVQMLAVTPLQVVVGWCDIVRNPLEGFRHNGRLGMGLLPHYRGRGLGKRIALDTIAAARQAGIERVELDVFASNEPAIALYRGLGFITEGIKHRARKLDGQYDDNVFMALLGP